MGAFYDETDETEASKTLSYLANPGMTFWDTADIYRPLSAMLYCVRR
jgi:aryl-alcohol dehydrogenase-like predicted oxidoreductase